MKTTSDFRTFAFVLLAISSIVTSCQREESKPALETGETLSARPPQTPPAITHGICDHDLVESTLSGWTKIFEDNFSADLSNWNIWEGGAYNNELQMYQHENLQIANDNLVINAVKETVTGPTTPSDATAKTFNYTSGRIESKTNFSASPNSPKVRMSARIKLSSGYGMWPAFWSYGDPWPTQGEIDILEARGQEDKKYQTNYFYGKTANRNLVRGAEGFVTTDVSLQTCYHVYEMVWSQNSLQFYFDGQLVKTNTGGYVPNLFGKQERITLNLAVGGNFFSNFDPSQIQTGSMYVDWVKVFTSIYSSMLAFLIMLQ
jgi:beta-glucanase (GH16 family)